MCGVGASTCSDVSRFVCGEVFAGIDSAFAICMTVLGFGFAFYMTEVFRGDMVFVAACLVGIKIRGCLCVRVVRGLNV